MCKERRWRSGRGKERQAGEQEQGEGDEQKVEVFIVAELDQVGLLFDRFPAWWIPHPSS